MGRRKAPPSATPSDAEAAAASAAQLWRLLAALPARSDEALAVLDGAFGDVLAEQGSPLAIPLTVRSDGAALVADRAALAERLPGATGRICVLVHGLMGTGAVWGFRDDPGTTYGSLLARDLGVTPLYASYNTGRHVSTNARELARLLDRLVGAWPVRVRDITLIGHSMGGLVVRGACHYGTVERRQSTLRRSWPSRVRRVVLIGVPNAGSWLEVLANLTSTALWAVPTPVTRLIGSGLDRRSAGIKDLRFGSVLDEDWQERDPDAPGPASLHRVRAPRRARYLVVAGTLTADPAHPVSRLLGDSLVTAPSATGELADSRVRELFPDATIRVLPTVTHLALASHPDVYEEIRAWW
ncbi:MAG: alpha/beta hydrolase [Acidimicrobiales bacterium]|nr:alpha/beta hydrolase [Acidimicrobiales bacterium]